jgi:hypothetical protein
MYDADADLIGFCAMGGNQDEALNLQQALRELPEEQRETVFLKVWGGMTLLEISEDGPPASNNFPIDTLYVNNYHSYRNPIGDLAWPLNPQPCCKALWICSS